MSDMTETDLENQRLREQLNHAALRVLELEQECQQLKTAQVDRSETIKEAYIWGMLLAGILTGMALILSLVDASRGSVPYVGIVMLLSGLIVMWRASVCCTKVNNFLAKHKEC